MYGGLDRKEVHRRSGAYLEVIDRADPEFAAEMRGIAEGARADLLDVAAVNVRYEILYSEFVRRGIEHEAAGLAAAGGCTSFALLPGRTSAAHTLIGQTWDWIPEVRGLLLRGARDGEPSSLAFTEAGIAGGKIGVNSEGIALAVNGLTSDRDSWVHMRPPFHVRCSRVLASRTLDEAVRAVTGSPRSCSANFLIAKAGEGVVDVEAAPETHRLLAPEGGTLVHTNHFMDPDVLGVGEPLAEDRPHTYHRFKRMRELLAARAESGKAVGVADLKTMVRDHVGRPNSICRHVDRARPPGERFDTVFTAIIDVDARTMDVASGPPCEARFRRVRLSGRSPASAKT